MGLGALGTDQQSSTGKQELTLGYGGADAVEQSPQGLAGPLSGQGVDGKAHTACPQAAELQGGRLDGLAQQRLQPLTPRAGSAAYADGARSMWLHERRLAMHDMAVR